MRRRAITARSGERGSVGAWARREEGSNWRSCRARCRIYVQHRQHRQRQRQLDQAPARARNGVTRAKAPTPTARRSRGSRSAQSPRKAPPALDDGSLRFTSPQLHAAGLGRRRPTAPNHACLHASTYMFQMLRPCEAVLPSNHRDSLIHPHPRPESQTPRPPFRASSSHPPSPPCACTWTQVCRAKIACYF